MPVIIDKQGNRYEYKTLTAHGSSICLDGYRFIQGTLADFHPEPAPITQVTRLEFYALFSGAERLAIKQARTTDDLVDDFFSMVDDPDANGVNLTRQSTLDALLHLEGLELITDGRRLAILAGVPQ